MLWLTLFHAQHVLVYLQVSMLAGDHTFSGGVFDPCSLNELFPRPASDPEADYEWQTLGAPVATKVRRSRFSLLSQRRRWWLPRPRQLRNRGNFLVDQRCGPCFVWPQTCMSSHRHGAKQCIRFRSQR